MSAIARLLPALVIAIAALSGCFGHTLDSEPRLVLAIQPTDNASSIMANATKLERFLEDRIDADVEIYVPLTYVGVVEAIKYHHADAALMSAWPSLIAQQKADAEIALAEKREVVIGNQTVVEPSYYSYYIVLKDSPYQNLGDLKGKTVAYPSTTSTSGYVYPLAKLVEDGLITKPTSGEADPKGHFGNVLFAGGYSQAWQALRTGAADVAVIAGDVNQKLYFDVLGATRVIATQGPVPSHALVVGNQLDPELRQDFLDAMLELKGEHRDLMRSLVSGIFVEFTATNTAQHTAPLAAALTKTGLSFQEKVK